MNARQWFYGPNGFGSTRGSFPDLQRAVPNEKWECLTCHRTNALNIDGRCSGCGSDAVQPTAIIEGVAKGEGK